MSERHFFEEEHFHSKDRKVHQRKDRPKNRSNTPVERQNAKAGRVVAITGEGVWVQTDQVRVLCSLRGTIKKEAKNPIAVGDLVQYVPSEGSIFHIEPRYSVLSRTEIRGAKEQIIAVNIDQALIILSLASPPLKPSLLDRYLIAAEHGQIHPIIVVNKIDQWENCSSDEKKMYQEFLQSYEPLGYPIISVSAKTGVGIEPLRELMKNKTSVIVGQSGVGKSSLLNTAFGLTLRTGDLTQKTFKGSHTTTTAELLSLPGGGFCIDTPGIRSFEVWNLEKTDLSRHFREFLPFASDCKYPDCTHREEPQCNVRKALEQGKLSLLRFASYENLLRELIAGIDNRTKRKLNL